MKKRLRKRRFWSLVEKGKKYLTSKNMVSRVYQSTCTNVRKLFILYDPTQNCMKLSCTAMLWYFSSIRVTIEKNLQRSFKAKWSYSCLEYDSWVQSPYNDLYLIHYRVNKAEYTTPLRFKKNIPTKKLFKAAYDHESKMQLKDLGKIHVLAYSQSIFHNKILPHIILPLLFIQNLFDVWVFE